MEALVITPELEDVAQRLAEQKGKTPTEAVVEAVRKELGVADRPRPPKDIAKIRALLKEIHSYPADMSLTEDEILGYDEYGVPEQPYLGR